LKIRTKLIIILVPLVSLSIFLISYLGLNNFTNTIQSEIITELKLVAINLMDKLSRQMFERTADIQFLSNSNILTNPKFTLPEKVDYLRTMERAVKAYTSISLYDKHGIKIGDTRNILIGANDSQEMFFKNAIKGSPYYESIPSLSESLKQYVIHFAAPIFDRNRNIQGVVVESYPIDKINDIFKAVKTSENQINAELNPFKLDLVSKNGTVIYSNYDRKSILHTKSEIQDLILKNPNQNNSFSINTNLNNNTTNGKEILVSASQGNGYLDYKGSGWTLILRENTDAVFGNIQIIINQFTIVAVIIVIISIIIILLIARNISLPLSKLMNKVIELGKGDYDTTIHIKSSDEIGELATKFELMRQDVNKVNKNLNIIVKERTKELEKANDDLKVKEINLKKLNEELVLADMAKEEFMSMVSHELKTPLVPARGYLELLLRQKKLGELNEKQKKIINVIYRNILKLEYLVNDVLDIYKLDIGQLRFFKNLVNVKELIKLVVSDSLVLTIDKNIILRTDLKIDNAINIICDQKRIEQVFSNLIKNSIDFVSPDTGVITISADLMENNSSFVKFSVEDNGPGIEAEEADNLFQKFYQIDTSVTRKHAGTGLGLVICKGIVEAHGGNIWIDKGYKFGARFIFTLPTSQKKEFENGSKT
jgi:signal transduction histidine kinase